MNGRQQLSALIVEDSEDDCEAVLGLLRNVYPEISSRRVESGALLHDALEQGEWDAIICSHKPPMLDAFASLRAARKKRFDIPFIMISHEDGDELSVSAMMAGAVEAIHRKNLSRLLPVLHRETAKLDVIRELRRDSEEKYLLAYYDRLTGLPNREWLSGRLDNAAASMRGMLLLLNIRNFLQIPQMLGLEAANRVLCEVAQRLRDGIGSDGLVARLGGDRFAIFLPGADDETAARRIRALGERLLEAVHVAKQELFLVFSLGASRFPQDGRDCHELLSNAETAMHQGKINGRLNYHFFDRGINADEQETMVLGHALHRAVRRGEFHLAYQPQFTLASGDLLGAEVLLRWEQQDGKAVAPDVFIPLLEKTGLIVQVGEWVLRSACMQNVEWQRAGLPPIRVAVNLSVIQFQQADLVPMVRRVLEQTGMAPRWLELEITENIAMHNEEAVISKLTELSDMGVSLAIDDFGTGYSSLSYLRDFPIHRLKIDRAFIGDMAGGKKDGSLVRAIVSLAHNLGLGVVAEGVENESQRAFLISCKCEEAQGFLLSPPLPPEQIGEMLSRRE